jgi:hypothetical protein
MESAFERTARLLLLEPKKRWTGLELSQRTGYSRAMTSRILKQLERDVVVAKPYKNRFVMVEPIRLLMRWSCRRKLPPPLFVKTKKSDEDLDDTIAKAEGVAVTLFRAAWLRTQYMKTTSYELYVEPDRIDQVVRLVGRISRSPERVAIYPADDRSVLLGSERIGGIPVVSLPQNFVDLMSIGGSGPRVALQMGNATGLLGV